MAKSLPKLAKREWEAAMELVLKDAVNMDSAPFTVVQTTGNKGNAAGGAKTSTEIPSTGPADGGPVLTSDPQRNDTDDAPGITDEIPAGGGFKTVPAKTPPTAPVKTEIPADGPASNDSPVTKPDTAPKETWNEVKDKEKGKENAATYNGDGWNNKMSPMVPSTTVEQWSAAPTGSSDGTGPDKNMQAPNRTVSTDDKAPRDSMKSSPTPNTNTTDNALSMPDGSFFVQNVGDLKAKIDAVKNADLTSNRTPNHPVYMDIKKHLMNRAADLGQQNLIPPDWQIMMATLADTEMARDINEATREDYLKKGWAIRGTGGKVAYPIGNAADLQNAITLARSGHGNVSAAKALIRRRAKDLGVKLPPDMM